MQRQTMVTRRGFIAGAAAGVASAGLGFPRAVRAFPDRTPTEAAVPNGTVVLIDRNESPYGMSPASLRAIQSVTESLSPRYPREEPAALTEALANRFGVAKEQILLGCGSTEILKIATETFCSPAGAAVVAEPTFEAVVTYSPLAHARAVKISLTPNDYKHDLPKMLEAATLVGGLIFFCNPSNPAGSFIDKREVERFVRNVPSGIVPLVDEAYFDYADSPDYESCIRYVKEGLPILVSRTFSKIYGMAGLRVGYAIGHKDLIRQMSERRLVNNPNQLATAAALAGLKDEEHVARIRKLNAQVRDSLCAELRAMGLQYIPSQTNFLMIDLKKPAKPVIEALKQRKVMVGRLFPSMPNHMRVTLGSADEIKIFLNEFKQVMA